MALNVKAAMLICMGYIGGMSWLVQQIGAAQADLPAPLVAHRVAFPPAPAADESGASSVGEDRRAVWVARFARANSLDAQAEANRAVEKTLALVEEPAGAARAWPPLALPPLVYEQREVAESPVTGGTEVALAGAGDDPAPGLPELLRGGEGEAGAANEVVAAVFKRYRVVKGDTLASIARREWKSSEARLVKLLVEANPQLARRPNRLVVGEELVIPGGTLGVRVAAGERSAEAETQAARWYTIQRNDSLQGIAKRCLNDDRRWREIMQLNGLADPNRIQPGTRIKLPPTVRLASR